MKKDAQTARNIRYYDAFAGRFHNVDLLRFNKASEYEFGQIVRQLDLTKKRAIIELGCGAGRYSLALARLGHRVMAADVSEKSLQVLRTQAKRHHIRSIRTRRHDFSSAIEKNTYDIGICISTYHVLAGTERDKIERLGNFIQSLKPGGTLLLVEPNPLNPLFYFFYLFYPGIQSGLIKNFLGSSPFRLQGVLSSLGMKSITIRYVGFLPIRWLKRFPIVRSINEVINRIPIVNSFSAFSYITARK